MICSIPNSLQPTFLETSFDVRADLVIGGLATFFFEIAYEPAHVDRRVIVEVTSIQLVIA